MPATHRIEIHKHLGAEEWCNTYHVECVNMAEAQTFGNLLTAFERKIHRDCVIFDYFLASTVIVEDRVFRHVAINLPGEEALSGSSYLPLYCTVRLDLNTLDSDPCRKYYRLPVLEVSQTNGIIENAALSIWTPFIASHLFGTVLGDNLYNPSGDVVVSASFHPVVQMRQLHRRRKKKVPVVPG